MQKDTVVTIEEMNICIAQFMGYHYNAGKFYSNSGGKGNWFKEAKYHSSWDWLMPVWFKVQNIGADLGYSFKKYHEAFHAGIDHQKIEKCHDTVYQFIQWYNKQKDNAN